jgi:hypothetical protein
MRAFIAKTPLLKKGRQLSTGPSVDSDWHQRKQHTYSIDKLSNNDGMRLLSWRQFHGAQPAVFFSAVISDS